MVVLSHHYDLYAAPQPSVDQSHRTLFTHTNELRSCHDLEVSHKTLLLLSPAYKIQGLSPSRHEYMKKQYSLVDPYQIPDFGLQDLGSDK